MVLALGLALPWLVKGAISAFTRSTAQGLGRTLTNPYTYKQNNYRRNTYRPRYRRYYRRFSRGYRRYRRTYRRYYRRYSYRRSYRRY